MLHMQVGWLATGSRRGAPDLALSGFERGAGGTNPCPPQRLARGLGEVQGRPHLPGSGRPSLENVPSSVVNRTRVEVRPRILRTGTVRETGTTNPGLPQRADALGRKVRAAPRR